jgi:hypothetical protein
MTHVLEDLRKKPQPGVVLTRPRVRRSASRCAIGFPAGDSGPGEQPHGEDTRDSCHKMY